MAKIGHITTDECKRKISEKHKGKKLSEEQLWNIDNGVTLCKYCHKLTRKKI